MREWCGVGGWGVLGGCLSAPSYRGISSGYGMARFLVPSVHLGFAFPFSSATNNVVDFFFFIHSISAILFFC